MTTGGAVFKCKWTERRESLSVHVQSHEVVLLYDATPEGTLSATVNGFIYVRRSSRGNRDLLLYFGGLRNTTGTHTRTNIVARSTPPTKVTAVSGTEASFSNANAE